MWEKYSRAENVVYAICVAGVRSEISYVKYKTSGE